MRAQTPPRPFWTSGALVFAISLLAAFSTLQPVLAAGRGYAGTWAADLANCIWAQCGGDAPLILTEKGYDQHEAHCRFTSVKPAGGGEWKAAAECSVEGDTQAMDVGITVSGDTLTLTEGGGSRDLLRCP